MGRRFWDAFVVFSATRAVDLDRIGPGLPLRVAALGGDQADVTDAQ